MQWKDKAIIISCRKYGETSLIINVLTSEHGLHAGLVRGIKRNSAACQPGNMIEAVWKARLEDHLGSFTLEATKFVFASIINDGLKLSALESACALVKDSLPEREPHPEIYSAFRGFIEEIGKEGTWLQSYIKLELELLFRLGFGLDLEQCAASGTKDFLFYVSPRTGRAVSQQEGTPYHKKLLKLPSFLRPREDSSYKETVDDIREIVDGTLLTRYFLEKHIFVNGEDKLPGARLRFVQKLWEMA